MLDFHPSSQCSCVITEIWRQQPSLIASLPLKCLKVRTMRTRLIGAAVGPEFLPVFFEKCNQLLDPRNGILVLQVITMPEHRYTSYKRKVDFIQKHIFPGGHCPSVTALVEAIYAGSKGNLIIDKIENIGPHYAKALRIWGERFTDTFDEIAANSGMVNVYTPSFKRKWQFCTFHIKLLIKH